MLQNIRLSLRSYLCLCLCVCPPVDPLHGLCVFVSLCLCVFVFAHLLIPCTVSTPSSSPLNLSLQSHSTREARSCCLMDIISFLYISLSYNSIAWTDFMNIQNCLSLNQVCSWENNCQLLVVVEKVSVVKKST